MKTYSGFYPNLECKHLNVYRNEKEVEEKFLIRSLCGKLKLSLCLINTTSAMNKYMREELQL
jgi:hypothetical protein